jgi:hypothetical protein
MKAVMTVLLVAAFAPTGAAARQHVPAEREAFMRQAAAAAERYADRREAIADGFRRTGLSRHGGALDPHQPDRGRRARR